MKAGLDLYKNRNIDESNNNQSEINMITSSSNFYKNESQSKSTSP